MDQQTEMEGFASKGTSEGDLRREADYVKALQAAATAANEASTLEDAVRVSLPTICALLGWPVAHLYLLARETGNAPTLVPSGVWYLEEPERFEAFRRVTEQTAFPTGVGLPGRVLAAGKPAWVPDVRTDPNFPRATLARDLGVAGSFGVPVLAGTEVVGVLEFFCTERVESNEQLVDVLANVGIQLGRVAERERAQAALRESELRFRSVTQSAIDAIISADSQGLIVTWNVGAQAIFGYAEEEVRGRPLSIIMPERYRAAHQRGMERMNHTGQAKVIGKLLELHGLRKDGTEFPLELSLGTWETEAGRFYSGVLRDITERKRVEERLIGSEGKYRMLIEQASDGIAVYDMQGDILEINTRACEMLGYSREELLKLNVRDVIAPDDLSATPLRYSELLPGRTVLGERVLIRKDGTTFPVELSAKALDSRYVQTIVRDITQRKRVEEEIASLYAELERRVLERTAELSEANIELEQINAELAEEIAERKLAEERLAESARAREELFFIVSHELKNPLGIIKGYAQLLQARLSNARHPDAPRMMDQLSRIDSTVNKMNAIISELLDFARLQVGQPLDLRTVPTDLVALVRRIAAEYRHSTELHAIEVRTDVPQLVGMWDPVRLEWVVANLLSNAIKYSPRGGEIRINIARLETNEEPWAVLTVEDQGIGIPEQDKPYLFEWFRRAANASGHVSGAGIGLAASLQSVSQHGGTIEVESREGEGSTFTVRLPLSPPAES